jgi:hypothetical protein
MRVRRFLPFLLLLGCASCAALPREPLPAPAPEELLLRFRARAQAVQGLKGLAHVRVSAPGKNFFTPEVIFARRPGFLRLEILSPLGTPLFYFTTDGEDLFLYHPGENRYSRGPARANRFPEVLPAGLEPQEVVSFLLGGFPLLPYEDFSVRFNREDGLWRLELGDPLGAGPQVLKVDPQTREVFSAEYLRDGVARRLSFEDYRTVAGVSFPHRIHFQSPAAKTRLTVEYDEIALNPDWEEQDFRLPIPRGARVVPLE